MKDTRTYTQLLRDYLRKYGSSPDCLAMRLDSGECLDASGIEAFTEMIAALTYEALLHGTWRGNGDVALRPCLCGSPFLRVVEITANDAGVPGIALYVPASVRHDSA